MLITESQLNRNNANCFSLLENMEWIDNTGYSPMMVPVVENSSLNAAVIKIEDLTSYAEANGIMDLGYALQTVCEASDIDPSAVVFSVQEENIIADQDTADLVAGIMNEGVGVVAVPISHNRIEYKLAEAAVEYYASTGDDSLLEAYANDDFDAFDEMTEAEARARRANGENLDLSTRGFKKMANKEGGSTRTTRVGSKPPVAGLNPLKNITVPSASQLANYTGSVLYGTKSSGNSPTRQDRFNVGVDRLGSHGSDFGTDHMLSGARKLNSKFKGHKLDSMTPEEYKNSRGTTQDRFNKSFGDTHQTRGANLSASVGHALGKGGNPNPARTDGPVSDEYLRKTANAAAGRPDTPPNKKDDKTVEKVAKQAGIDNIAKQAEGKDRGWFASKIASLNSKMREYIAKTKKDPKNAGFFRKIATKIAQVIEWLTRRLNNIISSDKNQIGSMPK